MLQNDLAASYAKQDQDRQLERMTIQRQQQQFLSPTASNKPQELFRSLVPPELSPSPLSNELSLGLTSTNSCLGPQPVASSSCYNHSIASAADPRQQPQIGDELHSSAAFRHSSASVDHKSLNLTNFSQQQQLLNNNPAAAHNLWAPSDPHRSEHYANYVINSARRSNSFLQALDRQAQARQYTTRPHHHHHHQYHHQPSSTVLQKAPAQVHFSRKRLSVNLSSYPTRHRHLLTPVGPPPKPPMPPTQRLSEGPQPKAATADEQPSSCTGTLTDDLGNHQERRGRSAPRLRFQGELHQVLVGMEQRQDNADSLENIQMIVDEESPSYAQSIPQQQQQQQQQIVTVPQLSPANEYNENMGTIKLVRTPRSSSSPPPPPPPLQVPTMILDDQNLQLQERAQQGLSLQVTNKKAPLQKTNSNSSSTSGANYLKGAEHAVRFDDLDSSRLTINNDTESQRPARRSGQDSHGGRRSRIYPSHEESQLNEEDEEEDDYSRSSRRRGQSSERPCRRRQATPYIFSEVRK